MNTATVGGHLTASAVAANIFTTKPITIIRSAKMSSKDFTVHASAAETVTANSPHVEIPPAVSSNTKGVHLVLNITAASGTTPTLDVKVQRFDQLSGVYVDLAGGAFAQKVGTGSDDLIIYPGVTVTANRSVSSCITEGFRCVYTIGGGTPSFTFTLGGTYLP